MSKDTTGTYEGTTRRKVMQAIGAGTAATALAGCGDLLGVDDDEEGVTIGHIGPADNVLGIGSERAAEMAIDKVNDEGGIMDEDVELITGDTQVDAGEAETVVEEMIDQEGADIIVGAFQSEVARAIIDLTSEFNTPYLGTGPASPDLTRNFPGDDYDTYKNYFRVGPINTDLQAEAMADYCAYLSDEHGWNSLTFYRDQATWTQPFGEILPGELEDLGLTIEEEDALSIQSPDLSPIRQATEDSGADYMLRFFAHISGSPSGILGPWHQDQLQFGIEGIHVPGMHPEYDIATEGVNIFETTSQSGAGGVAPLTEHTQGFRTDYEERFADGDPATPDGSPMYMGFGTYDAILLAQDVLNEVGTTEPADELDDFVDEMLATEPGRVESISGDMEFYEPDSEYPHDLKEIRNDAGEITNFPVTQFQPNEEEDRPGQVECVFPENYATADHLRPAWMQ